MVIFLHYPAIVYGSLLVPSIQKGRLIIYETAFIVISYKSLETILQTYLSLPAGVDRVYGIIMSVETGRFVESKGGYISAGGFANSNGGFGRICRGNRIPAAVHVITNPVQDIDCVVIDIGDEVNMSPIVVDQIQHIENIQADR